jgi:CubicO group peptidase (beta-lactamase class C family)
VYAQTRVVASSVFWAGPPPRRYAAGDGGRPVETVLKKSTRRLAAEVCEDGVGGLSFGVVSGNRLVWTRHYGYAESETKRAPTNDTVYRVGSITKQFTAMAMLQLVEQGTMRLTDPLERYVPEIRQIKNPPAGTPPITLLQVSTMHSGLSREPLEPPWCSRRLAEVVVICADHTPWPGRRALSASECVARPGDRASGIGRSSIRSPTHPDAGHVAVGHGPRRDADLAHGLPSRARSAARPDRGSAAAAARAGQRCSHHQRPEFRVRSGKGPAGILKKETQDANYARAFFSNAAMTSGYGVGFQISRRGEVVLLGHGGSTAGYHASALVHRPSKLGVIVLRNCDSCPVDAGPVGSRALERLVLATK